MRLSGDQLIKATLEALDRSAFVFAEPAVEYGEQPEVRRYARIRCTGSIEGELHLGASDGFLRELAASMLGVDVEAVDAGAEGADALKEMANMIAGSVIVACGGAERSYTLGLPEVSDGASFETAAAAGVSARLSASGEPLTVVWRGSGAKAAA